MLPFWQMRRLLSVQLEGQLNESCVIDYTATEHAVRLCLSGQCQAGGLLCKRFFWLFFHWSSTLRKGPQPAFKIFDEDL